jgi:hypothetical protein
MSGEKKLPEIGDRVIAHAGIGWGYEEQTGIVTGREVLPGAEFLGELCEVTFEDGFQLWTSGKSIEVVPPCA